MVGCTERRKEPRMTVELVDTGMFTLVPYNLDSIALIAFTDLSQQHNSKSNQHQLKVLFGLLRVTHSARGLLEERKEIKP